MTDAPCTTADPAELVAASHAAADASLAASPEASTSQPADPDPNLDPLDTIRRGLAPEADASARALACAACRSILAALGEPMPAVAPSPVLAAPRSPTPTTPIAAIVESLRKLAPDQLLDLAIHRLRAALPADAAVAVPDTRFQLVRIPLPPPPVAGR
jgi:hypothetical protein